MSTPSGLICTKCGATNLEGWKYCCKCGKSERIKIIANLIPGEISVHPETTFAGLASELGFSEPTYEEFKLILEQSGMTQLQRQVLIRRFGLDVPGEGPIRTVLSIAQERGRSSSPTNVALSGAVTKLRPGFRRLALAQREQSHSD